VRRIGRRQFLVAAGTLAAAPLAHGQQRAKRPVLGVLSPHRRPSPKFIADNPFSNRLRALGWIEGRTLDIERTYGEGREDLLPALAATLVRRRVDVIWANGPEAAVAATRATQSIPIVFWGVALPVEQGLVQSLARPGGNVTGVAWYAGPGVDDKRLEALRDVAPTVRRLARITVPSALATVSGDEIKVPPYGSLAAAALGFEERRFPVLTPADFEPAFGEIVKWGAEALDAWGTTLTVRESPRIVGFANRQRLPSSYTLRLFAEAGGLIAYAIEFAPTLVRSAEVLDRILRGANPAEIPVDVPRDYELTINLKTARALGLVIPQDVLLRAARIID
jgi:ABC-type uncharacterized transport system substrate-binding protein